MFRCFGVTAHIFPAQKSRVAKGALFLGAGLLAVMTLNSCDHEEPPLVLTKPITHDTLRTHTYACQIHSRRNFEIHAPERGYLQAVNVEEGQRLKEGDPMFKILPQTYTDALNLAQAQAQEAKTEYENVVSRLKTHEASDKEAAMTRAKWDQKLASLSLVQSHPQFTTITAPFNGLMGRLRLGAGSLVNAGELLTTLFDNHEMWIDFSMPEAHYLEYSASMPAGEMLPVKLRLANGRMFDQTGRLNLTEAKVSPASGTIPFRAVFPNPKALLRHGGTGNIILQTTIKNALLVPQQSTFKIHDHFYIYVMDKDHVIRQKQISISQELESFFVVTEGVGENDTILFDGMPQVHDGELARDFQFEEPSVAYAHLSFKSK